MYIKKSILLILAVLVLGVMIIEALVVARAKEAFMDREYHGLLNRHIAQPYEGLVEELLDRHEAGDMDALGRALKAAEDRKYEMGYVWLSKDTPDAYRDSVDAILK